MTVLTAAMLTAAVLTAAVLTAATPHHGHTSPCPHLVVAEEETLLEAGDGPNSGKPRLLGLWDQVRVRLRLRLRVSVRVSVSVSVRVS